ncbi:MAG TPA: DUF975 family protein [Verrucomicrobiae bacterium]
MDWYYAVDKQQKGPVNEEQLAELLRQGVIQGTTLVWHQGMSNWQPYEKVAGTAGATATPGMVSSVPSGASDPSPEEWAEQVKKLDVEITVGECFGKGWEAFQRNLGVTIGVVVLVFLTYTAINAIPLLGLASIFIYGPLYGGFMYYFVLMIRGEECRVGNAFLGFGPKFVPLMLAGLLITIITFICVIPGVGVMFAGIISAGLFSSSQQSPPSIDALSAGAIILMGAGFLIMMVLMFAVTVFLQFSYLLILDKDVDLMTAIKLSVRQSARKWVVLFLLSLAGGIVNFLGALLCGVGLLFTVPWYFAAIAVAYEKLFPGKTAKLPY